MGTILIGFAFLLLASVLFVVCKKAFGPQSQLWIEKENRYFDPELKEKKEFPNLLREKREGERKTVSVIVPAYNEEERMALMIDEAVNHLTQRRSKDSNFSYEIILVDDGSKDKTSQIAIEYSKSLGSDLFRTLTLAQNRGKGGALRRGFICARGDYILMADADGATKFSDFDRMENELKKIEKEGQGITIGSRAHLQEEAVAKRSIFRNILMYGFHFVINVLAIRGIKDTQCGFKLFTRKSARLVFPQLKVERWAFDIELILLAQQFNIPMSEVAVNWTEIPGSKLSPVEASIQMLRDVFRIRIGYLLGFWKIDKSIYD